MVLGGRPPGRVGRRRDFSLTRSPLSSGSRGLCRLCEKSVDRGCAKDKPAAELHPRSRHLQSSKCPRSRHGQTVAPPRRAPAVQATLGEAEQARGVARHGAAVRSDRADRADRIRAVMAVAPAEVEVGRVRGDRRARLLERTGRPGPAAGARHSPRRDPRRQQSGPVEVAHRAATARNVEIVRARGHKGRERDSRPAATIDPTAGRDAHQHEAPPRPGNRAHAATPSMRNSHCRAEQSSGATWPAAAPARSPANGTTPTRIAHSAKSRLAAHRRTAGRSLGPVTTAGTSGRTHRPRSDAPAPPPRHPKHAHRRPNRPAPSADTAANPGNPATNRPIDYPRPRRAHEPHDTSAGGRDRDPQRGGRRHVGPQRATGRARPRPPSAPTSGAAHKMRFATSNRSSPKPRVSPPSRS